MDYSKITKVKELSSAKETNEYLDLGWKMINTYTTAYDTQYPGCNYQTIHYVMAWMDGEPVYPTPKPSMFPDFLSEPT